MSDDTIGDGKVVSFHYTLSDDQGAEIESSTGQDPLVYLHGSGSIVTGLENALSNKSVGDRVDVIVPPEEGYGVRDERGVQTVARAQFPPDADLEAGTQFGVKGPDGQMYPCWVKDANDDEVTIDFNHPLAGENLHFAVTVEGIRDASDEEKEHGHAHEPGHHHHH
jgi:FKBP-type peptidyl-prolyl cis-trans isomerase SlyD